MGTCSIVLLQDLEVAYPDPPVLAYFELVQGALEFGFAVHKHKYPTPQDGKLQPNLFIILADPKLHYFKL
jgi:hypothetical protein